MATVSISRIPGVIVSHFLGWGTHFLFLTIIIPVYSKTLHFIFEHYLKVLPVDLFVYFIAQLCMPSCSSVEKLIIMK